MEEQEYELGLKLNFDQPLDLPAADLAVALWGTIT